MDEPAAEIAQLTSQGEIEEALKRAAAAFAEGRRLKELAERSAAALQGTQEGEKKEGEGNSPLLRNNKNRSKKNRKRRKRNKLRKSKAKNRKKEKNQKIKKNSNKRDAANVVVNHVAKMVVIHKN